jgi:DNA-binding response OmpR family regulator
MLSGKIVLVVDDEAGIRHLIARAVRAAGGETFGAANGRQAMLLLERAYVDLAVVDILMPEKEGIETIMEMKSRSPGLKIIAISGGGRIGPEDFLRLAGMIGADATMKKPLNFKELIATIAFLLDHETAESASAPVRSDEAPWPGADSPRFRHRGDDRPARGH